jgi:TolB-like protein/class 3 adenylate cyclase
MTEQRRLAAIVSADVAGYSRLMGQDESGTLAALKALRQEVVDPAIARHGGRIVKTIGDGLLMEFPSVIEALRCATEIQAAMATRNLDRTPAIELRIGINFGDVVVENGDILGDAVNVAARLEALADLGGICVAARVREDAIGRLDLVFEDMGEQALKNIARPVRTFRVSSRQLPPVVEGLTVALARSPVDTAPRLKLPEMPSIAVLPFQNIGGDPEQEYFADGMVEEIITALTRTRWLFVIARNSSFSYKGQLPDSRRIGRELGVRYLLEGSIRKGRERIRVTGQLIEAESGKHLWADRFDGSLEDVFELQDQVATNVAAIIGPALQTAEIARSSVRPTSDLTAYDFYLRAQPLLFRFSRQGLQEGLALLHEAIARDASYAPALAMAAFCHFRLHHDGWSEDFQEDHDAALDLARRALQAGPDDAVVIANTALVLAALGEDMRAMYKLIDRALVLNPSYARGWHISGVLRVLGGELETAIEHFERASRLSPRDRDRLGGALTMLGQAYFYGRRFDEAVETLLAATQEHPMSPQPYRALAACYAHMGRLDDAREAVRRLKKISPAVMPTIPATRNTEHRELMRSGLMMAMGEP